MTESERRAIAEQTLASWRLAGFEPDQGFLSLLDQWVTGEISVSDLTDRINAELPRALRSE